MTENAKHTPGPWREMTMSRLELGAKDVCPHCMKPGNDKPGSITIVGGTKETFFGVAQLQWCVIKDREKQEANARLIAAAPELLEALRMIIEEADGGWLKESKTAKLCLSAIAKAEGRE